MSLQTDIDRLFWRFQNGTFKPNQKDLDALVSLCTWINRQKEVQRDNTLLSKMYVLLFKQHLQRYEDIGFAQYSLNSKLDRNLEYLISEFQAAINQIEFIKFCRLKNIQIDIETLTDDQQIKIIQENQSEYLRLIKGKWDYEKIEKALYNQITEVINNYKNKL